ncbi:unnamed protein product [Acanthoscelides obtectus]|uniref:Alpha-carbonic anhydrase domain-containing protein n=1 Tax=Acanthoscelides obtectus TaxID=200917 RepID=A0A9P0NU47_ACAOB|nr:unnamed protein product [Acanthoscelides obtectus]CAK1665833.1 hypothetical protein AOBTE_LOCUS24992 [Acanthoscelides obtectus]
MSYWDYWERGPQTWSDKYPAAKGKRQSPIDIPSSLAKETFTKEIEFKYHLDKVNQVIENVGYSWKLCLVGGREHLQMWG